MNEQRLCKNDKCKKPINPNKEIPETDDLAWAWRHGWCSPDCPLKQAMRTFCAEAGLSYPD